MFIFISFIEFGKFAACISLTILSSPLSLSLLFFWDSHHMYVGMFNVGTQVSETPLIFLQCFFSLFFRLDNLY